jgi:hypothetical protein
MYLFGKPNLSAKNSINAELACPSTAGARTAIFSRAFSPPQ